MCYESKMVCKRKLGTSDAEVLARTGALQAVEHVVRTLSAKSLVVIVSDDCACAEIIGNVAADWVCRLLGDVRVDNLAYSASVSQSNAVLLMMTGALLVLVAHLPFYDWCCCI